ncbi:MAG: amino acid adenylation domain-containing protein, partial [bacterium]|nr:amino acid adenylation domain-containing protein [bacterium]
HIVADGISLEILAKELWELYDDKELPPLRLQYKDFSEWLNSDDQVAAIKEQENFWLGEFEGEIPLINLPTDYPRPAKLTFDGDTVQFGIDALETEQLNKIAADHGESLYMVLFASFNVLLARVTGQEDIVVGTVTAGRGHTDLEQIVGMFLNTLALRSYPEGEKSFETFLSEVKLTAFHAFEHQDYPFDDLVRKVAPRVDASRNPLFDVVFGLENEADPTGYLMEVAIPDKATPYDFGTKKAKFDMTLICIENEAGIEGSIEYKTKLFNRDTIRRFTGYFKKIISYICSDVTQKISQIDMLPRDERKIILNKFNDMTADYPSDKTIHEIFEEHVEKNPENPALMMKEQEFTYSELNERCNRLAAVLRDNRVCPNTIVALMTGRTMELIIAQLGILKAGGAYLSIDIELPDARKKFLLDDSNAGILLVRSEYLEENKAELRALFGKQIIAIDDESIYAGVTDVSNQPTASGPDDLAYVIYTSGTTGKPKGVMMHHRGIASLNVCTRERFQLDETSRVLQFATVSFDASVWEVWMALMNGAALVLVDTDTIQNYERFIDYINSKGITITLLPPIYVNHIDPGSVKTFKTLLTGGAAAGSEMVEKWRRHVQYVNCYGPTEASICCTMWKASKSGAPVTNPPIGVPVDNTNIHIVDKHMNLVPIGVSGELCVSGIHVAKGYLNRPELTDEKFIDDPILEGNRMYRTGDLVRWLPDGTIEYSGRIDFQVKIRGFRIEPGEIENCIARHDSIKDAAVLALDNKITKEKFLCAYFVPHESMDLDVLKDYLHEELPEYMVPSYFVQVDTIPLTPSGKVDKKQLPEPEIGGSAEGYEAPRNGIERQTADVWVLVLGVERVGIEDDFFELGGDSIKAIQIISRLQKGGLILEVSQLFLHKTIKQLGRHIKPIDAVTVKKADQRIVTGNVRLTPIEEWFFKEQDEHARDHFNQYMMFISKPKEGGYDKNHIGEVFKKIMEHHDALRMIYKINGDKVIQENKGVPANEVYDWVTVELENIANDTRLKEEKVFYSHDLKDEELEAEHIDAIAARVHQSFDLEKGPLLKLCLFKGMRVDYLLIVVHHVVVDGISWRILMDDFETGYNQAVKREEIRFSDKTHSFQYWAEELSRYAASSSLLKELPYWNAVENTPAESLPVDCQIERRTFGDYPHTVRELSQDKAEAKEYTRKLKEDVRRAYQTEINDILLAAVGLAVRVWAWKDEENRVDISDVLVNLEGHGREKVVDVDITRTVGWFSTQYPVILDMALSEDRGLSTGILDDIWNAMDDVSDKGHSFQDFVLKMTPEVKKNFDRYVSYAVRKVKETLRRIPNKGIGYGILKYLTTPEKKENIRFKHAPEIVFNYLGEFGGFDYDYIDRIKGLTDMDFKMSWSNDLKFGHKLDIESIIADGELKLYMFYNEKEYVLGKEKNYRGEPDRIKDLAHLIKAILLAVIDHCAEKTVTRLTPYDLGCSKISITGLDRITGDIQARISEDMEIESIYPLTAFQEEMFRATSANKEAYFVQNMFSIPEDADTGLLEESFNIIIDRFQVMRTVFVDAGHDVFITGTSPEPLQIVLKKRTLQIEIKDIAHLSGDEQQKELERIKAADKEAGFDLTTQLPLKVTLVKTGGAFDRLLWSQNHITIDGWCLGVIISDLLDAYDALKANTSPAFEPVYPYRDYIDWLEQADMAEGLEYHREYLAGYKQGVTLASLGNTVESGRFKLEDYYLTLDETVTEGLNRTASKTRVTLNTLFQVLWGVLLQRYTHADDVLFGAIVSGRSAELEGIDTIAGLFINIIPVRIRSGETTTFSALVTERQEQSARSKKHEYFPLPEALGQAGSSATGGPVIDNLMFFENYPLDEENRDMFSGRKDSGLKIEWIENRE